MDINYEYKIDFAIIISVISLLITIIKAIIDYFSKKRAKYISALGSVYPIAYELINYPLN